MEESKSSLRSRKEAAAIKKRSLEKVAEERKRLQEETRLYIIELAALMAQKYIGQTLDDEMQNKIFDEALTQLEEAQWQN